MYTFDAIIWVQMKTVPLAFGWAEHCVNIYRLHLNQTRTLSSKCPLKPLIDRLDLGSVCR